MNAEVEEYLQQYSEERDSQGRRQAVRNGFLPERTILTGVGPLEVRQPRVEDRGLDESGEKRSFLDVLGT